MLRKKKKFEWPRKLYDKNRILEENKLKSRYGLKNKKEIWKAEAKIKYFRKRAKNLITADIGEQESFFGKLNKVGLNVKSIADVLSLNVEDILKRRLSSILVEKQLANTHRQARQMIVHKTVLIADNVVNVPSYLVKVDEKNLISVKKRVKRIPETKSETVKENLQVEEAEVNTNAGK